MSSNTNSTTSSPKPMKVAIESSMDEPSPYSNPINKEIATIISNVESTIWITIAL